MRVLFLALSVIVGVSVSAYSQTPPITPIQISELNPDCVRRFIVRFDLSYSKDHVISMLQTMDVTVDIDKEFEIFPLVVIEFPPEKNCSWINEKLNELMSRPEIKRVSPDIPSPPS